MNVEYLNIIITLLTTIIAFYGGTFIGKRKLKNDFLNDLQNSIDLLASKNKELLSEVVLLRDANLQLMSNQAALKISINQLKKTNLELTEKLNSISSQFKQPIHIKRVSSSKEK